MIVKLLTEYHLEFLSSKGGSSESTHVKMSHCWKSHVMAQYYFKSPNYRVTYLEENSNADHVLWRSIMQKHNLSANGGSPVYQ